MQINESKKAFICFLLFFQIGTFQWAMADSNKKNPLPAKLAPRVVREGREIRFALPFSHREARPGVEFYK
jgi:hypothetical protein